MEKNEAYKYAGLVVTGKQLLEEDWPFDLELVQDFLQRLDDNTPVSPENNQEMQNDEEERSDRS